jgi:hypothetical protein
MELSEEMIQQILKEVRLYEAQWRIVEWELKRHGNNSIIDNSHKNLQVRKDIKKSRNSQIVK